MEWANSLDHFLHLEQCRATSSVPRVENCIVYGSLSGMHNAAFAYTLYISDFICNNFCNFDTSAFSFVPVKRLTCTMAEHRGREIFLQSLEKRVVSLFKLDHHECCVCFTPYYALSHPTTSDQPEDNDYVYEEPLQLPCNHIIGSMCLLRWAKEANTCPFCRAQLFDHTLDYNGEIDYGQYGLEGSENDWVNDFEAFETGIDAKIWALEAGMEELRYCHAQWMDEYASDNGD